MLRPKEVVLFIHLLCVACESATNPRRNDDTNALNHERISNETITKRLRISSTTLPKQLRMGDTTLTQAITRLEEFQLLKVHENDVPFKLKEIKLNKTKLNKTNIALPNKTRSVTTQKQFSGMETDLLKNARRQVWDNFSEAYKKRWNHEPTRNAMVNRQISQFVDRIGVADAPEVIKFYVSHNDSYYVKKTHQVGLALKDAETLHTQWKKGLQITSTKMRQFEKHQEHDDIREAIREGKI